MLYRHGENSRTCAPLPDRGGRAVAGFEDGERQAALGEVRGGGQADRAGADDDDRQVFQWVLIKAPVLTVRYGSAAAGRCGRVR